MRLRGLALGVFGISLAVAAGLSLSAEAGRLATELAARNVLLLGIGGLVGLAVPCGLYILSRKF